MAELDISGISIQLDCSVDSGICVEGVTKDIKKKLQEFKRILFILERDKEAMRLLRERLSRIAERKIVKKKKDGQSVCNVCFTQIDTDDSKTCIACCSCAKNVCRDEKCSEWVSIDGEWRCQLCAARRDSYGKASTWLQEQYAVKRASLTEFSYPMRARSEIYIPLCDPNESAFLCNFESVSEAPSSPINPNQKQQIREYIEEVLADMIGGSLGNATVEPMSTNEDYQQVRNGHELQGVSNVRLRQLIESIITETIRQPPFASAGLISTTTNAVDSSDIDHRENLLLNGNHCNGNGGQYFESKKYHDLLATAVLNKIVNTHGNGRLSESSPDLTSSSILDNNHNALNLNKTEESISSSSSVEPRSESSLTDPIRSINKNDDLSAIIDNYGNFYDDDVAIDNIEAGRESVLSDFISSHMVPLPHISTEEDEVSAEDEDEEDFISVASSRDANWEDNWLFKKKKSSKTSATVGMLVPAPKEDIRALIGDKPTDEVSDLSEAGSDTDDSSLEMVSASLEPLNDRLVNKHLIGGKNTKIVLDELVDQSSMISTSSLPDNVPPYTETKNEFVVSNDGLNESESLKISVNNCTKAISNEAINSNVTKSILTKAEKLVKEIQVTEDETIVSPPNDFTDDEKMRNLLAKFNEEQSNKTDSGDDNSSSLSPRSSISCALSAGIDRAELDAYEGITDFCVEDEEGLASEIDPAMAEESSSRRPSVIEILAAIALGPMLAVSASDDRNILTELELSSLMELNELAMAQLNDKTAEERRLGVIAEESFDSGPGDDCRIEAIESNEEGDLLSSPKMVMDAIRDLVGKDAIKSVSSEGSSITIEEITEESAKTEVRSEGSSITIEEITEESAKIEDSSESKIQEITDDSEPLTNNGVNLAKDDSNDIEQDNTKDKNRTPETEQQIVEEIILYTPVETMKKTEEQTNQEKLKLEEIFEIVPGKGETTSQCEVDAVIEIQSENQTIEESKVSEVELDKTEIKEIKPAEGYLSNNEEYGITMNSLSDDLSFDKVIPEDTSSISDESLHTIGSSSDYSEDLGGDTTSYFIDEENIAVTAELSDDKKLQESKEEIQIKSTGSVSDKTMNEFILPPPIAFCDEQRKLNEDDGYNEPVQEAETHINSETVQIETQMTSENSNNEPEAIVTEGETHNEDTCTDNKKEPKEVTEDKETVQKSETEKMTASKEVLPQGEKSEEPSDKQSIEDDTPKIEVETSSTEVQLNEPVQNSEIEAENKKLEGNQKDEECSQDEALKLDEEVAGKTDEQNSKNIAEEQTASTIIKETAALKILSEAHFILHELSSGKSSEVAKTETNSEIISEDPKLAEESTTNESKSEDSPNDTVTEENSSKHPVDEMSEIQSIQETLNDKDVVIIKEETPNNIVECQESIPASLKTELSDQGTSKQRELEELSVEKLTTEFTRTDNIEAWHDDTIKAELKENSEAKKESPKNKCEPHEEVKIEAVEIKKINEDQSLDAEGSKEINSIVPDDKIISPIAEETEKGKKSEDGPVENSSDISQPTNETLAKQESDLQQTEMQNQDISQEVAADVHTYSSELEITMTANLADSNMETNSLEDQSKSLNEDAHVEELDSETPATSEQLSKNNQTDIAPLNDVTEGCSKEFSTVPVDVELNTKVCLNNETITTEHEVLSLNHDLLVGENPVPEKISEEVSTNTSQEDANEAIAETNVGEQNIKTEEETLDSMNNNEIAQASLFDPLNSDQAPPKIGKSDLVSPEISQQVKTKVNPIPIVECTKEQERIEAVVEEVTKNCIPPNLNIERIEEKECHLIPQSMCEQSSDVLENENKGADEETTSPTESSSNLEIPQTADIATVDPFFPTKSVDETEDQNEDQQATVSETILLDADTKDTATNLEADDIASVDPFLPTKNVDETEDQNQDQQASISETILLDADTSLTSLEANSVSNIQVIDAEVTEIIQPETIVSYLNPVEASNKKIYEINSSRNSETQKAKDLKQCSKNEVSPQGSSETCLEEKTTESQTLLSNEDDIVSVVENTTELAELSKELLTEDLDKNDIEAKKVSESSEIENTPAEAIKDVAQKEEEHFEFSIVKESISEKEEKSEEKSSQTQKEDTIVEGLTAEKLIENTQEALETSEFAEEIKPNCSSSQNESTDTKDEPVNQQNNNDNQSEAQEEKAKMEILDEPSSVEGSSINNLEDQKLQNDQSSDNKTDDDKQVETEKSKLPAVNNAPENQTDIKKDIGEENDKQIQENTPVTSVAEKVTKPLNDAITIADKTENNIDCAILIENKLEILGEEEQTAITEEKSELSIESTAIKDSASNEDPIIHSLREDTSTSKETVESVSKTCADIIGNPQEDTHISKEELFNKLSETSKVEEGQLEVLKTEETVEVSIEPEIEKTEKSLDGLESQSETENQVVCEKITEIANEMLAEAPSHDDELSEDATQSINSETVQVGDLTKEEQENISNEGIETQIKSFAVERTKEDESQVVNDDRLEVKFNTLEVLSSHSEQNLTEQNGEAANFENLEIVTDTNDENLNIVLDAKEQTESSNTEEPVDKILSDEINTEQIQVEIRNETLKEEATSNETNTFEATKPSEDPSSQSADQNQIETTQLDKIASEEISSTNAENIVENPKDEESVIVYENETVLTEEVNKTEDVILEVEETTIKKYVNSTQAEKDIKNLNQLIPVATKPDELSVISSSTIETANEDTSTEEIVESTITTVVLNETLVEPRKSDPESKEQNSEPLKKEPIQSRISNAFIEPSAEAQTEFEKSETTEPVKTIGQAIIENNTPKEPEIEKECKIQETEHIVSEEGHEISIMEAEQEDKTQKSDDLAEDALEKQESQSIEETETAEKHFAEEVLTKNDDKIDIHLENQKEISESPIETGTSTSAEIQSINADSPVREERTEVPENIVEDLKSSSKDEEILTKDNLCTEEMPKQEFPTEDLATKDLTEENSSQEPAAVSQKQVLPKELPVQENKLCDSEKVPDEEKSDGETTNIEEESEPTQKSEELEIKEITSVRVLKEATTLVSLIDFKEDSLPTKVSEPEEKETESISSVTNSEENILKEDVSIDETMPVEEKPELPKSEEDNSEVTNNKDIAGEVCIVEKLPEEDVLDNLAPKPDIKTIEEPPIGEREVQTTEKEVELETQEAVLDANGLTLKTDDEKIKLIFNVSESTLKTDDEKIEEIPVVNDTLEEPIIQEQTSEISLDTQESVLESKTASVNSEDIYDAQTKKSSNQKLDSQISTKNSINATASFDAIQIEVSSEVEETKILNESESQNHTDNIEDASIVHVNSVNVEENLIDEEIPDANIDKSLATDSEQVNEVKVLEDSSSLMNSEDDKTFTSEVQADNVIATEIIQPEEDTETLTIEESPSISEVTQITLDEVQPEETGVVKEEKVMASEIPNADADSKIVPVPTEEELEEKAIAEPEDISSEAVEGYQVTETSKSEIVPLEDLQVKEISDSDVTSAEQIGKEISTHELSSCSENTTLKYVTQEDNITNGEASMRPTETEEPKLQDSSNVIEQVLSDETTIVSEELVNRNDESTLEQITDFNDKLSSQKVDGCLPDSSHLTLLRDKDLTEKESRVHESQDSQTVGLKEVSAPKEQTADNSILETTLANEATDKLKSLEITSSDDAANSEKEVYSTEIADESRTQERDANIKDRLTPAETASGEINAGSLKLEEVSNHLKEETLVEAAVVVEEMSAVNKAAAEIQTDTNKPPISEEPGLDFKKPHERKTETKSESADEESNIEVHNLQNSVTIEEAKPVETVLTTESEDTNILSLNQIDPTPLKETKSSEDNQEEIKSVEQTALEAPEKLTNTKDESERTHAEQTKEVTPANEVIEASANDKATESTPVLSAEIQIQNASNEEVIVKPKEQTTVEGSDIKESLSGNIIEPQEIKEHLTETKDNSEKTEIKQTNEAPETYRLVESESANDKATESTPVLSAEIQIQNASNEEVIVKPKKQTTVEGSDIKESLSGNIIEPQEIKEQLTETKDNSEQTEIKQTNEAPETDRLVENEPILSKEIEAQDPSYVKVAPLEKMDSKEVKEEVSTETANEIIEEPISVKQIHNDATDSDEPGIRDVPVEVLDSEEMNSDSKVFTTRDDTKLRKDSIVLKSINSQDIEDIEDSDSENSFKSAAEENIFAENKSFVATKASEQQTESTTLKESLSVSKIKSDVFKSLEIREISEVNRIKAEETQNDELEAVEKDDSLTSQKPVEPDNESELLKDSKDSMKLEISNKDEMLTNIEDVPKSDVSLTSPEDLTKVEECVVPKSSDSHKSGIKEIDAQAPENIEKLSSTEEGNKTEDAIETDASDTWVKTVEIQNQEITVVEATFADLIPDSQSLILAEHSQCISETVPKTQNEANLTTDENSKSEHIISSDEKDKSIHSTLDTDTTDISKPDEVNQIGETVEPHESDEAATAEETVGSENTQETAKEIHVKAIESIPGEIVIEESNTQIQISECKDASMLSAEKQTTIEENKETIIEAKIEAESITKEDMHTEDNETESGFENKNITDLTTTQDSTARVNDESKSYKNQELPKEIITESSLEKTIDQNEVDEQKRVVSEPINEEKCSPGEEKLAAEITEVSASQEDMPEKAIEVQAERASKVKSSSTELIAEPPKSPETIPAQDTPAVKSSLQSESQEKSSVEALVAEEISKTETPQKKVSAETATAGKALPIEEIDEAQASSEVILVTQAAGPTKHNQSDEETQIQKLSDLPAEKTPKPDSGNDAMAEGKLSEVITEEATEVEELPPIEVLAEKALPIEEFAEAQAFSEGISVTQTPEPTKLNQSDEDIQIQKLSDLPAEKTPKQESGNVVMAEDKLSEVITEQATEVEEIPPIEVLAATCKIVTHPPLQPTESLIESAQYLYDKISVPILETSHDINAPNLAEELRMAADGNDCKDSSKSERVIPRSIACESRCFTSDPQSDEQPPIASDSVATEQPNAQDANQGNHISQVAKQLIFAKQSARKSKAKNSSSKFRILTLRDWRFLAELEKRRKQRELIQNYLDSLDCIDTPSYINEDLYLFESKCSIERSPYSLFIEPSDNCIVDATSISPTAKTHFLKTNILFSDRISSESNCTDDSTTTVIDTLGSMESHSSTDSGEEFSPDDSIERDSSATATTANNSIVTTNKATNQSHIYSPPLPLTPQPQPELRTESACSKLIETRPTMGGNEEHVDDDPLKHLVPGSIAEREYKKWYNAVDMPNNPYSVEALRRRLSSGGLDRAFDLPNISPCNEENPLELCERPATEADNKIQERDYSRYSRDYYINDAKQASGTTPKKSPTSPPQISSPTSAATSIELDERVETCNANKTDETTPVREMCHKLEKQCRIESDIYLATPVQVIEDIPQAFADKNSIQAGAETITLLANEAVSKLSSETSSILTNESLTASEDSDTIRIYDLKNQETRLIKESTHTTTTTTITVPKSPEKKVRPTELDIMPTLAPPIATVSSKSSTPTSFKFLQPRRKLISPSQVLSIDLDTNPITPATPEKPVIEAEVAQAMPSVKALAKAFLMTSSTSSSENKWRKARAKTPLQFFKSTTPTPTTAAAAASVSRLIQKQPEPAVPDTTSQGSEDATIASDLSSLETDPPSRIEGDTLDTNASEDRASSPVVLSGCLRNNIAFFENLKNK